MKTEQGVLKLSVGMTVLVACFGIIFGIISGSFSIAFDGVYALADAGMSTLALVVAKLITDFAAGTANERLSKRFSFGFWHLEPIVLGLNGVLLIVVSIYALINAVASIMAGGRDLEFGFAVIYAAVTLVVCIAMALLVRRANRGIRSEFLALDSTAWFMSASITAALFIAFVIGMLIEGTSAQWLAPYIDPAVLALVCVVIIPLPVSTVRQALSDILLLTPAALRTRVDEAAMAVREKYGFLSHRAYLARVGRLTQIELYFIVPPGGPAKTIEEWDALRDEIGDLIGGEGPDRWLTIAFTADREWAD